VSLPALVQPSADRDIDEIADYLADEAGLNVALEFLESLYRTLDTISAHPQIGRECPLRERGLQNIRQIRVGEAFSSYLIFYLLLPEKVTVLRVLHGARDIRSDLIFPEL
jgi:toxin ParE1/3/4